MHDEKKDPFSSTHIGNDVILLIMSFLSIREYGVIAQVSRGMRTLSANHFLWNCLLKPNFQTVEPGVAKKIFLENPAAREKHVFFDQAGKDYVAGFIKQRIQEEALTDIQSDYLCSNRFQSRLWWSKVSMRAIEEQIACDIQATSPQSLQGFNNAQIKGVQSGLTPGETQTSCYRAHSDYYIEHGCAPKYL